MDKSLNLLPINTGYMTDGISKLDIKILSVDAIRRVIKAAGHKVSGREKISTEWAFLSLHSVIHSHSDKITERPHVLVKKLKRLEIAAGEILELLALRDRKSDIPSQLLNSGSLDADSLGALNAGLKQLATAAQFTAASVQKKLGKSPAHKRDMAALQILACLLKLYESIFSRKATFNNRSGLGGTHNSPFLRFASKALEEMEALGYKIMSNKPPAIRAKMPLVMKIISASASD